MNLFDRGWKANKSGKKLESINYKRLGFEKNSADYYTFADGFVAAENDTNYVPAK